MIEYAKYIHWRLGGLTPVHNLRRFEEILRISKVDNRPEIKLLIHNITFHLYFTEYIQYINTAHE